MKIPPSPDKPPVIQIKPVSLGGVKPGVNLDKATALADSMADEIRVRKLKEGK